MYMVYKLYKLIKVKEILPTFFATAMENSSNFMTQASMGGKDGTEVVGITVFTCYTNSFI